MCMDKCISLDCDGHMTWSHGFNLGTEVGGKALLIVSVTT